MLCNILQIIPCQWSLCHGRNTHRVRPRMKSDTAPSTSAALLNPLCLQLCPESSCTRNNPQGNSSHILTLDLLMQPCLKRVTQLPQAQTQKKKEKKKVKNLVSLYKYINIQYWEISLLVDKMFYIHAWREKVIHIYILVAGIPVLFALMGHWLQGSGSWNELKKYHMTQAIIVLQQRLTNRDTHMDAIPVGRSTQHLIFRHMDKSEGYNETQIEGGSAIISAYIQCQCKMFSQLGSAQHVLINFYLPTPTM